MPFGSRASKVDQALAALQWGPSEPTDPAAEIRVPITAIGPPSAAALAQRGLTQLGTELLVGRPLAMFGTPPPPRTTHVGRTVAVDPVGLRHVDIPKGVSRLASVHLNFAVRWVELWRVTLEVVASPRMGMYQTRMVLIPGDPAGFAQHHPEMAPMCGAGSVGPSAWMLSLGIDYRPDQDVVSWMLYGLGQYGGSVFSGTVDVVNG